jgi:hypothetical protein
MKNPDYEIRKGRRIGSLDGKKRNLANVSFGLSKTSDNSSGLGIMLYDKVDWASVIGSPVNLNFYLTNNSTGHLTQTNGLVNLNIPILPVIWDTDSPLDLEDFVKNGRDTRANAQKYEEMDEKLARFRKEEYAAEIENYILFEFGIRYAKALKQGDQNAADIIKNLIMMKDFDFGLCCDIVNDNVKSVTPENLPFIKSFKQYITTKEKFQKLNKKVEDYVYFDVDRAINGETLSEIYGSQPE